MMPRHDKLDATETRADERQTRRVRFWLTFTVFFVVYGFMATIRDVLRLGTWVAAMLVQ